jgi:hypothetical protein
MRILIVNRKSGVAKTNAAINPGAALAQAAELGTAVRDYTTHQRRAGLPGPSRRSPAPRPPD